MEKIEIEGLNVSFKTVGEDYTNANKPWRVTTIYIHYSSRLEYWATSVDPRSIPAQYTRAHVYSLCAQLYHFYVTCSMS